MLSVELRINHWQYYYMEKGKRKKERWGEEEEKGKEREGKEREGRKEGRNHVTRQFRLGILKARSQRDS